MATTTSTRKSRLSRSAFNAYTRRQERRLVAQIREDCRKRPMSHAECIAQIETQARASRRDDETQALRVVVEQPIIRGRPAVLKEIHSELTLRGFSLSRPGTHDHHSHALGVMVHDVHAENVIMTVSGLAVFDPMIYAIVPWHVTEGQVPPE